MSKDYEELEFTDDFMFGKVMEDRILCREVLECLLEKQIGELTDVQTEKNFQCLADGKPIRLDVYTKDEESIYDLEMQNLNHSTIADLDLPHRSRYYQSTLDKTKRQMA